MNLPGARRITTQEMVQIGLQHLLIDVMDDTGHHLTIPGAVYLPGAGDYGRGRFNDQIQKNFLDLLSHLTRRNADQPIIFFCYGAECWEAYNATLRAINMGFRNVLWYRGVLASWKAANFPLVEPAEIDPVR
jgi:PQQ-dependent catabolism-associated CXXCW motif protein